MAADPSRTWLVVIDMQEGFADPSSQWAVEGYALAQEQIERLVPLFRDRVVYTRFVPDPAEPGAWADYYDRWSNMRLPASSPAWDLTVPLEGAPVVSAPTFSKWGADLRAVVGQTADLVLCGVATDCCVLATALGAVDDGRAVTLVHDACAGVSRHHHDQAVALLGLFAPMVTVVSVDEVVRR